MKITAMDSYDVRFPTSRELDGSDAMNPDPDYSAAYVVLRGEGGEEGHGFCFTIGRGTELCVAAIRVLADGLVGARTQLPGADAADAEVIGGGELIIVMAANGKEILILIVGALESFKVGSAVASGQQMHTDCGRATASGGENFHASGDRRVDDRTGTQERGFASGKVGGSG